MELYIILALIQGFIFGWVVHRIVINYQIHKALKQVAKRHNISIEEMIEEISKEPKVIRVPYLFTELVDNSIMLFNKETKQFICQATNLEELAKNLMDHNKIKLAVVNHNDENLWFVEGKVKKDIKEYE
jgi:hypothetical protein